MRVCVEPGKDFAEECNSRLDGGGAQSSAKVLLLLKIAITTMITIVSMTTIITIIIIVMIIFVTIIIGIIIIAIIITTVIKLEVHRSGLPVWPWR